MDSWSEIRKANSQELLSAARRRLKEFPILKRVYDEDFLIRIVRKKNNRDNILLFWLVNSNPIDALNSPKFMQDIESDLDLFQLDGNFGLLKQKLRQWRTIPFESAVTELDFMAEYCRKGYKIELEPLLPNKRRGDFCACKDSSKFFFEVKMIFNETSMRYDATMADLHSRFDEIEQPFIISIDMKDDFRPNHVVALVKYLRNKLKEIGQKPLTFPFSLTYPEANPTITLDFVDQAAKGEKGHIRGIVYGGGIKSNWVDVRRKIVAGVGQLHPDYPGVIIARPFGIDTLDYDIRNALYGDLAVRFNQFGSQVLRHGDRIFDVNKNNRLSAVIYYRKRYLGSGYEKEQVVYHNPFALRKICHDVFDGKNVTQF